MYETFNSLTKGIKSNKRELPGDNSTLSKNNSFKQYSIYISYEYES